MSRSANVRSVDAIREFKAALLRFIDDVRDALISLRMELARARDWIETDRPAYCERQVRDGWTRVSEARVALELSRNRSLSGQRAASRDEIIALEKARQEVRRAEEMVEIVQQWRQTLEHEIHEYDGHLNRIDTVLDIDLARSLATLDRMIAALDAYAEHQLEKDDDGTTPATRPAAERERTPESTD
jgi:hypothetical protein